ncbi:hypothetical protein JCM18750_14160 [Halostagnicola bangensis]
MPTVGRQTVKILCESPMASVSTLSASAKRLSTNVHHRRNPKAFLSTVTGIHVMATYTATVTVRLKHGVLDPEAETTKRSLERLGFDLEALRSADRFEIDLEADSAGDAEEEVEEMAERLLANPTIHDYDIDVAERE